MYALMRNSSISLKSPRYSKIDSLLCFSSKMSTTPGKYFFLVIIIHSRLILILKMNSCHTSFQSFSVKFFTGYYLHEYLPYILHPFLNPVLKKVTIFSTVFLFCNALIFLVYFMFNWDANLFVNVGHTNFSMIAVSMFIIRYQSRNFPLMYILEISLHKNMGRKNRT